MKKLAVLIGVVIATSVTSTAQAEAKFPRAELGLSRFATELHTQPITWIGPDGVPVIVDRYYEYEAVLKWSRLPRSARLQLQIFNPTKDETATIDVSGLSSYTFSGTVENGSWAFPGDRILFSLIVCPRNSDCLTYEAEAQVPA